MSVACSALTVWGFLNTQPSERPAEACTTETSCSIDNFVTRRLTSKVMPSVVCIEVYIFLYICYHYACTYTYVIPVYTKI